MSDVDVSSGLGMRDDIHRHLSLPRPWKRVVKVADVAAKTPSLLSAHAREWRAFVDALPAETCMRQIVPSRARSV
jgi:hypothetical protein